MEWYWLPEYAPRFAEGLWLTIQLLLLAMFFGMAIAIPVGLVQVTGPRPLAWLESFLWPILRDAFPYAVFALTLSVAGYEGEILRGAFRSVPNGELEAARAMGMSRFTILRRIWLPRALQNVFPTLTGEFILTLKATPLVSTITIYEAFGVGTIVRQETYRIYEPLLLLAGIYACLTLVLVLIFRYMENRIPKPSMS